MTQTEQTSEFNVSSCIKVIRIEKYAPATRAVVATQDIKKGKIIELCPVIRMPYEEVFGPELNFPTISHYCFGYYKGYTVIALGFGSLYNHSETPNAKYEPKASDALCFEAIKDIATNEEITVDYYPDEKGPATFKQSKPQ